MIETYQRLTSKRAIKKVSLRQLVEQRIDSEGLATAEIRHREVSLANVAAEDLSLEVVEYETTATSERFLQWVTPQGKIAGFLRLSLPHANAIARLEKKEYEAATSKTVNQTCALPFPLKREKR